MDVLEAVFVHKDVHMQPRDDIVMSFLNRYVSECSEMGKKTTMQFV